MPKCKEMFHYLPWVKPDNVVCNENPKYPLQINNVMGILRIHPGKVYDHAGKKRRSRCLKKNGSNAIVMASSANPLNKSWTIPKKIAPKKTFPSVVLLWCILVRKKRVIMMNAIIVSSKIRETNSLDKITIHRIPNI
jgi:hypothetical protein